MTEYTHISTCCYSSTFLGLRGLARARVLRLNGWVGVIVRRMRAGVYAGREVLL